MKTLLFTLEYPPFHGGVANYYGNLVKYWPSSTKATAGKPKSDEILVLDNNDGRLLNNKLPLLKWLPAYFALYKKIKQNNIRHILVGQILPLGTIALICAKFCDAKYSIFLHGLDLTYALKRPRKKWLAKEILKNAEKIICTNSYVAKIARQAWPQIKPKIVIANPGAEKRAAPNMRLATQLRNRYNLQNKIVLLSVGRLIKRKGFDLVIKALPEVLKKVPNLVYVIIGDGPENKNLMLDESVYIINQADDEERDLWYNISDIFIMTSRNIDGDFEGFGIVYLEANLAGKPVIAAKSGGVADAVIDGLNGLLVDPPEDTEKISSAIIKLAQNFELKQKLGEQGKERAINEFNWGKQIDKIYKFIMQNSNI